MSGRPDLARRDKAFHLYAQYRNMSKVSKELKIPTQTILRWKNEDQWELKLSQLKDRLRSQHEIIEKAKDNVVLEKDLSDLRLIETLEAEVAEAITSKKIQILDWKDAIKTLEFTRKERRLIMGEPTDRPNGEIEVTFTREEDLDKHIDDLKRFIGEKKPDSE